MGRTLFFHLTLALIIFLPPSVRAQDTLSKKDPGVQVKYGSKGFEFRTSDNRHLLQIQSRVQFRYSTPADQNPLTFDDFIEDRKHIFKINRARFKVGGHAFKPWLKYYWEYDVAQSNLLDFRLMIEKWDYLNLKVGQWKIYYNRERVISSGKQQLVDRSILTRPFTIDRQQGVSIYGRIFKHTPADITYHLTTATGMGRGATSNDDDKLMYVGRLQWNLFGRELEMTSSDLDYHEKFTGSLALAGATNNSPYTRFSSGGGGMLEGFPGDSAGQYLTNQFLVETAFMWKGFSWQQEYHYKEVIDNYIADRTYLDGNLMQAGYFFHHAFPWVPEPLEVAVRYSYFRPDREQWRNIYEEYGLALNWFFNGHANKLTAEVTFFDALGPGTDNPHQTRFRVQWDISL